MRPALKLQVTIPTDRLVQLPDDVPEGQAEIIVLFAETPAPDERARKGTARKQARRARSPAKTAPAKADRSGYYARLVARQPSPLSARASRALDEADRGER